MAIKNGVPLSIRTRKTMPKIGYGNGNAEKTKDQLYIQLAFEIIDFSRVSYSKRLNLGSNQGAYQVGAGHDPLKINEKMGKQSR
jgi:hypothetical protein